jgi:hypothetical protein
MRSSAEYLPECRAPAGHSGEALVGAPYRPAPGRAGSPAGFPGDAPVAGKGGCSGDAVVAGKGGFAGEVSVAEDDGFSGDAPGAEDDGIAVALADLPLRIAPQFRQKPASNATGPPQFEHFTA